MTLTKPAMPIAMPTSIRWLEAAERLLLVGGRA